MAAWALGKYSKGTDKMHTLLDLRGNIPANIHITDGKWHDSNELDEIVPKPFAFYMMDKAYVDFIVSLSQSLCILDKSSQRQYEIRGR
ncbi:hypothetical protein [Prevotella sp.]|uniref:hypothetical protein n=1 Tax=Prevotella sp. TaxID=59823 RepID=UPI0035B03525